MLADPELMSHRVEVFRINVLTLDRWRGWPDHETSFGKHPAPWKLDALLHDQPAGITGAQLIFVPGDGERLEDWLSRWLADAPVDAEPFDLEAIAGFLARPGVRGHPLVPMGLGSDLFGAEMRLPALWNVSGGLAVSLCPVRIVERRDNPVSFVVWGEPVWVIGAEADLSVEQKKELSEMPGLVDYGTAVSLWIISEPEPSQAPWAYRCQVAASIEKAVSRAEQLLRDWNLDLLGDPSRAELDVGLKRLESLRRSLPSLRRATGIHGAGTELQEANPTALPPATT